MNKTYPSVFRNRLRLNSIVSKWKRNRKWATEK